MALYTPLDFPGLVAWYDGLDASTMYDATSGGSLVSLSGIVKRWENKVSASHHLTMSTSGAEPTRAASGLLFDGTNDYMTADTLAASVTGTNIPFTAYVVCAPSTLVSGAAPYCFASSSSTSPLDYCYSFTSNNRYEHFRRNTFNSANYTINYGTPLNTDPVILSYVYKGATGADPYRNGVAGTGSATNLGATGLNFFTIGAFRRSGTLTGSNFWNGTIHAFLLFTQAHTPADRKRIEGFLSEYYEAGSLTYPEGIAGRPSLQCWLDFADASTLYDAPSGGSLVAADGNIRRAEDKSGNAYHATESVIASGPTRKVAELNGRDVARLDGSNDRLSLGTQLGRLRDYTIIAVTKAGTHAVSNFGVLIGSNSTNSLALSNYVLYQTAETVMRSAFGNDAATSSRGISTIAKNEWFIISTRHANGNTFAEVFKDAEDVAFSTFASGTGDSFGGGTAYNTWIGRYNDGSNPWYWNGDIAEILIFSRALSDMEWMEVHAYLSDKYGLGFVTLNELSELCIGYPDVPMRAANITTSLPFMEFQREHNLWRGPRSRPGVLASASGANRIFTFTMPDDKERRVNYIFIAHADFMISSGDTSLFVQFSNDGTLWQTAHSDVLTTADLKGRFSSDYFANIHDFGPKKYWRVLIGGATEQSAYHKIYLGKLWNPGTWPDDFIFDYLLPDSVPFTSQSGAVLASKSDTPKYYGRFNWTGISDEKLTELFSNHALMQTNAKGIILYNPSQNKITDQNELIHCNMTSLRREDKFAWPDWNDIIIEIVEMIG